MGDELGGPALARRDDPVSSHLAALEVEGKKAPKDRVLALEAVHKFPGRTTHELAFLLESDFEQRMLRYESLHRRLPELRKAGIVRSEVVEPRCRRSRRLMQRWWMVRHD